MARLVLTPRARYIALLPLVLAACYSPQYGPGRVRCASAAPICPEGFSCTGGFCEAPLQTDGPVDGQDGPATVPCPSTGCSLDLLFVVDDSASMLEMQAALTASFAGFVNALKAQPGGLPDLHLGVMTTDNGAGKFSSQYPDGGLNCGAAHPGDPYPYAGAGHLIYQKTSATDPICGSAKITGTEHYLVDVPDANQPGGRRRNYSGDISDVFRCFAQVGANGCGFEAQLESARQTLERAKSASAPAGLQGFLRDDAVLAVVFLTNEDDCSVPPDSELLDPGNASLGFANSFRCTEYGILCAGQKVPRMATTPLSGCVSNDDAARTDRLHSLIPIADYIGFFRGFKPSGKLVLAALTAPTDPFLVALGKDINPNTTGSPDIVGLQHSCRLMSGTATLFGDPPVRIKQLLDAFVDERDSGTGESTARSRARSESICQTSYDTSLVRIANLIRQSLQPQ